MQFKWHILFGFVISYSLIQFFDLSILAGAIIFLSSWMIDIDHYFWYSIEAKDFNPMNAIRWYNTTFQERRSLTKKEKNKFKKGIFIFHSFMFWAILLALSFIEKNFFYALCGVAIHMLADFAEMMYIEEPITNKVFISEVIRRNKNKKSILEI